VGWNSFFTLAPGLLCIATAEGRFVKVSTAWQRVLGWSIEQLEGAFVLDFMHPDDAEAAKVTGARSARAHDHH